MYHTCTTGTYRRQTRWNFILMGPDCKIARAKFTVEPNLADR